MTNRKTVTIETTSRKSARKHSRELIDLGFTAWIINRSVDGLASYQVIGEK